MLHILFEPAPTTSANASIRLPSQNVLQNVTNNVIDDRLSSRCKNSAIKKKHDTIDDDTEPKSKKFRKVKEGQGVNKLKISIKPSQTFLY